MASGTPFGDWHKQQIIDAAAAGRHPRTTARELGFTWATVKAHLNNDPGFRAAVTDAIDDATAVVEDKLYSEAVKGNLGAIRLWLTNRGDFVDERNHGAKDPGTSVTIGTVNIVGALREGLGDPEIRHDLIDALSTLGPGGAPALVADGDAGAPGPDGHG